MATVFMVMLLLQWVRSESKSTDSRSLAESTMKAETFSVSMGTTTPFLSPTLLPWTPRTAPGLARKWTI